MLFRLFVDPAWSVSSSAGVFHSGNYGPPVGFCFDQFCQDEPIMDDPLLADYNVERRASEFADACQVRTLCLKSEFCFVRGEYDRVGTFAVDQEPDEFGRGAVDRHLFLLVSM